MAEQFAVIIVEKVAEKLIDPIIRQFSYVFCYKSNIKSLRDGVEDLQNKKAGVTLSVDAAKRNLQIIGPDVVAWLGNVEENEKKAREVLEGSKIVKNGCLNGWCPNLKQRYLVSKKAVKQTVVVKEIQKHGEKYTQLAYPALPAGMVSAPSTTNLEVFESRISQTKEVIKALKNENFSKIGICGLGGVGKTRMAKEIRDRAVVEDLFDEVTMAVITENQNLKKIQDQLASMLGLKLEEQDIIDVRGKRLRERLIKGSRVLVILDDVYKELDLGELGIPVGGQGESKGCKVLITSRDEHVCTAMGTKKNFVVKLLSDREAWDLFKEKSGVLEETGDLYIIAKQVSEECGRLPLAIVIVGVALKGKGKDEWQDALEQLQMCSVTTIQGMEEYVYSRLRLSYNLLDNNQLQGLFLLCCIFPEDYDIAVEELVRYAMGLKLYRDVPHLASARRRVQSLVNRLKSCYLLLASDEAGYVKVHDVVRQFGLKEASRVYLVRHGVEYKHKLQNDLVEPYTAISIRSKEELELPHGLVYPSLQLLELAGGGSIQISTSYFEGMEELRVVSFNGHLTSFNSEDMCLESLFLESPPNSPPKAVQFFMNVRTLCLEKCRISTDISFIGGMQKLEILSFLGSKEIDVLPSEIGQLTNLKLLDLRNCRVRLVMPGVLSSLKKLEDLYMGDYFRKEGVEELNQGYCASITELYSLSCLKTLQVHISEPEVSLKLKDFSFDVLKRFYIVLNFFEVNMMDEGFASYFSYELEFANIVMIGEDDLGLFVGTQLEALMRRTEMLYFTNVGGWKNIIRESDEDAYKNLKKLSILGSDGMVDICHGNLPVSSMGMLETVYLSYLCKMTSLCSGQVHPPCFVNLKVFNINQCHAIRSLFSPSMARCLVQLHTLRLNWCSKMEEIVSKDGDESDDDARKIEFPKLVSVEFSGLGSFRSFTVVSDILGSHSTHSAIIFSEEVLLPSMERLDLMFMNVEKIVGGQMQTGSSSYKLRFLKLYDCCNLSAFTAFEIIKVMPNLETLDVDECNSMEALFDLEGTEVSDEHGAEVIFGQLHSIKIRGLNKLVNIWRNVPKLGSSFSKLTLLDVSFCNKLMYLFSPYMAKLLVNLQEIKLKTCSMMEQVITTEEEEEEDTGKKMDTLIVFPRLRMLKLEDIKYLKSFYEGSRDIEFPSLEEMLILFCPNMNNFCSGSLSAPKLKSVQTHHESFSFTGDLNNTVHDIYKRSQETLEEDEIVLITRRIHGQ